MTIVSFIDGRVRLRDARLKDPETAIQVEALVRAFTGVTAVTIAPRTGSLLVEYDPTVLDRHDLQAALLALEAFSDAASGVNAEHELDCRRVATPFWHRSRRGKENLVLATVFGLTLASALWSKKAHVALGTLCSLLTAGHVVQRRRCFK